MREMKVYYVYSLDNAQNFPLEKSILQNGQ